MSYVAAFAMIECDKCKKARLTAYVDDLLLKDGHKLDMEAFAREEGWSVGVKGWEGNVTGEHFCSECTDTFAKMD